MKTCWLDLRDCLVAKAAICEEAVHQRVDGILVDDPADYGHLPPTISRICLVGAEPTESQSKADIVIVDDAEAVDTHQLEQRHPGVTFGRNVRVSDPASLEAACRIAATETWSLLEFSDPTKIPLEIVLAAAAGGSGTVITRATDLEEATVIFGVLEQGSGVLLAPREVGDATALVAAAGASRGQIDLVELIVTKVARVGMGERACVDTCTYFNPDEGILVGSHSKGMVLCVSETHPLPYMPTRPFRVNAGAIMSYTLISDRRTNYLSELEAGKRVLAVDTAGRTREVTVGRVKIETRPLLSIDAVGPSGQGVNLILQDDWHVRVLGPGSAVLNSTELKPGDRVLGHIPTEDRHVGYPINEFCREQ
jgi:3-amino-4-hydroxybenzoic acid synthase